MILATYAVFNLIISRGVIKDAGINPRQTLAQILLTWLVPIVGACIVLAMLGQHHTREEMRTLVPFPFYFAGYTKLRENPYDSGGEG